MRWASIAKATSLRTALSIGRRSDLGQYRAHTPHDLAIVAVDEGGNERFLGRIILVKRADAHAGHVGDPVGAGFVVTVADQDTGGRIDKRIDGDARSRLRGLLAGICKRFARHVPLPEMRIEDELSLIFYRRAIPNQQVRRARADDVLNPFFVSLGGGLIHRRGHPATAGRTGRRWGQEGFERLRRSKRRRMTGMVKVFGCRLSRSSCWVGPASGNRPSTNPR